MKSFTFETCLKLVVLISSVSVSHQTQADCIPDGQPCKDRAIGCCRIGNHKSICLDVTGTCSRPLVSGSICKENSDCEIPLFCRNNICCTGVGNACDGNSNCCQVQYGEPTRCLNVTSTCKQPLPLGSHCITNSDCQSDLVCGSEKKCISKKGKGESCSKDDECQRLMHCYFDNKCDYNLPEGIGCNRNAQCEDHLFCDDESKTCKHRFPSGTKCKSTSECKKSLLCNDNKCCIPEGQPCKNEKDKCCGETAICLDTTSKCGEPLIYDSVCTISADCQEGLICGPEKTCEYPRGLRANCTETSDCQSHLICGPGMKCENPRGLDESCTKSSDCRKDLFCNIRNICHNRDDVGGKCEGDNECKEELFCNTDNRCKRKLGYYESCLKMSHCQKDLYCNYEGRCLQRGSKYDRCLHHDHCLEGMFCELLHGKCHWKAKLATSCFFNHECKSGYCNWNRLYFWCDIYSESKRWQNYGQN